MPTRAALAILLLIFVVLCGVFVSKTPYRQGGTLRHQGGASVPDIGAPDERQHANYVNHLLTEGSFPVFKPGSPDLGETYQSHQPPLYYILAAGWSKISGADPADQKSGGRIRILNIFVGIGTLLGVFCVAKWGLDNEHIALAAVAFAGLMPMFVALHSSVSNDPLLFLICTWTLAFLIKGIRKGWNWKLALVIGALAGLGLVTKTSALALFPTIVVALVVSYLWGKNRPCLRVWAICLMLPLLVAAPWMMRNQNLYGDLFVVGAFKEAFVGSPKPQTVALPIWLMEDPYYNGVASRLMEEAGEETLQGQELVDAVYEEVGFTPAVHFDYWANWVGWWTARSYLGVFGYMDIFLAENYEPGEEVLKSSNLIYRAFLVLCFVLAVGWLLSFRDSEDASKKAMHIVCAALLLVIIALFVRFNLQYFQGQARYLYPAVAPISIGLAIGASYWLKSQKTNCWMIVSASLIVINILAIVALNQGFAARM